MRTRTLAIAVLLGAGTVLGACSDDGSGADPDHAASGGGLAGRLPAGANRVASVDLDGARDQLGLPAGTGVDDVDVDAEPERARLLTVAALGLPYLGLPPEHTSALRAAIDTGLIHEAAAVVGFDTEHGAAVLRTDQAFADLAARLADEGYAQDDDLLVSDQSDDAIEYPVVADGGDGTVVLAQSEAAARAVLDGGGGSTPAVDMLARLTGVVATAGTVPGIAGCGGRFGVGADAEPTTGQLVVFAGPDPDPANALPGPVPPGRAGVDIGARTVDGEYVVVDFEYDPDPFLEHPAHAVVANNFVFGLLYDCSLS